MAGIPLEDNYTDVVAKAQRGLGLGDAELARQAGMSADQLARFKSGSFDAGAARKIAGPLQLGFEALSELARQAWAPEPVTVEGLAAFNTPYHDMTVNSFLVFDVKSGQAAAFDTGASASGMLETARARKLKVVYIFLTHSHPDHVADLARLEKETGASAYIGDKEGLSGPKTFAAGEVFRMGALKIETRLTSGHARGGVTFVVTGLERRLAIVGDALFAASMGGGAVSYEEALRANRREIFSLPDDTVVCPGHGPMTTVGEQKKHNPFYPEFQK